MNRLIYAISISFLALGTVSAGAASPTPSPGLDQVLVAPPSGYAELTSSPIHGSFTAHDYAMVSDQTKAAEIEKTLSHDGFVDGYGKTWIQGSQRAMVEAVIAFTGGRGARSWLTAAEAGDKTDPSYVRADSISGISPYYGGHFKYPTNNTVGDVFSFVKGNDVFIVGMVSTKDDVLSLATTQTRAQYDQAPGQTIPTSQWPENASNSSAGSVPLALIGIIVALIVVAVAAVLFMTLRRRGGMTPATAGAPGTMGSPPVGNVQMSTDGKYWWDGQNWRDAATEAPPSAQRSSDGALWWDGQNWRPVPQGRPAATPTAEWPQSS